MQATGARFVLTTGTEKMLRLPVTCWDTIISKSQNIMSVICSRQKGFVYCLFLCLCKWYILEGSTEHQEIPNNLAIPYVRARARARVCVCVCVCVCVYFLSMYQRALESPYILYISKAHMSGCMERKYAPVETPHNTNLQPWIFKFDISKCYLNMQGA